MAQGHPVAHERMGKEEEGGRKKKKKQKQKKKEDDDDKDNNNNNNNNNIHNGDNKGQLTVSELILSRPPSKEVTDRIDFTSAALTPGASCGHGVKGKRKDR